MSDFTVIRIGLEKELNVSYYAIPEFNREQMVEIYYGLENKINVELYLNPSIDWREMKEIRLELQGNKK